MLLLKACPHCHGDLVLESDRRCAYLECIHCGHTLSIQEERTLGIRATRRGGLKPVGPVGKSAATPSAR